MATTVIDKASKFREKAQQTLFVESKDQKVLEERERSNKGLLFLLPPKILQETYPSYQSKAIKILWIIEIERTYIILEK